MAGSCRIKMGSGSQGGNWLPSWMLCRPANGPSASFDKHLDFLLENYSSPLGAPLVALFDQDRFPVPTPALVGMRS